MAYSRSDDGKGAVEAVVREHLDAYNAHDTGRILRGLTPGAVWQSGWERVRGRPELAVVFDDVLWELRPRLALCRLVVDDDGAAADLVEELTVDGERRRFAVAAFFEVRDGLVEAVKIFRTGELDVA